MANASARVMQMVRRELKKDRAASTEELFDKAKKIDPSLSRLTNRQFHAKYPLQIKRTMKRRPASASKKRAASKTRAAKKARGATRKRGRSTAKKATRRGRPTRRTPTRSRRPPTARAAAEASAPNGRDTMRGLLLQFAKEVAAADGKADMVDVLTGVDQWVDRMVAAANG